MSDGLPAFRDRHPAGSIITELLRVEQGLYVVRALALVDKITLGSGLGAAETVEQAEDRAIQRALTIAGFTTQDRTLAPGTSMMSTIQAVPNPVYLPAPERNGSPKYEEKEEELFTNLSDLIAATAVELQRIGWTNEQGRNHLTRTYGKSARKQLNEEELRSFLSYLKTQPTLSRSRNPDPPF